MDHRGTFEIDLGLVMIGAGKRGSSEKRYENAHQNVLTVVELMMRERMGVQCNFRGWRRKQT